jgi:hypothetical protein
LVTIHFISTCSTSNSSYRDEYRHYPVFTITFSLECGTEILTKKKSFMTLRPDGLRLRVEADAHVLEADVQLVQLRVGLAGLLLGVLGGLLGRGHVVLVLDEVGLKGFLPSGQILRPVFKKLILCYLESGNVFITLHFLCNLRMDPIS